MTNTPANAPFLQDNTEHSIHMEQLKRVELFNGRAAMLGLVIGVLTEAITGSGIAWGSPGFEDKSVRVTP
jgi:hypothetical protein